MIESVINLLPRVSVLAADQCRLLFFALLHGVVVGLLGAYGVYQSAPKVGRFILMTFSFLSRIAPFSWLMLIAATTGIWGFWTAFLVVCGGIVGIIFTGALRALTSLPPGLVKAAQVQGLSVAQRLLYVEGPNIMWDVVAAVRRAALFAISMSLLVTLIGQPSLGNLLFSGLAVKDHAALWMGVVGAWVLAVMIDTPLAIAQHGVAVRSRPQVLAGLLSAALVLLVGSVASFQESARIHGGITANNSFPRGAFAPTKEGEAEDTAVGSQRPTVRMGRKESPDQHIITALVKQRLAPLGIDVEVAENLGAALLFEGLKAGTLDIGVESLGVLWQYLYQQKTMPSPWYAMAQVRGWLAKEHNIRVLGSLGYSDAPTFAMTQGRAKALEIYCLDDLRAKASQLTLGQDDNAMHAYSMGAAASLEFAAGKRLPQDRLFAALSAGEVDVLVLPANHPQLEDTLPLLVIDGAATFDTYGDMVLLLGARVANEPTVVTPLQTVVGRITNATMRHGASLLHQSTQTPDTVALWLSTQVQLGSEGICHALDLSLLPP